MPIGGQDENLVELLMCLNTEGSLWMSVVTSSDNALEMKAMVGMGA